MSEKDITDAVKKAKVTNLNDQYPDDVDYSLVWLVDCSKTLGRNYQTNDCKTEAQARAQALDYFMGVADDLAKPTK